MSTTTNPGILMPLATPNADRDKLARMAAADPTLVPLLVRTIAEFMRSEPLPK